MTVSSISGVPPFENPHPLPFREKKTPLGLSGWG